MLNRDIVAIAPLAIGTSGAVCSIIAVISLASEPENADIAPFLGRAPFAATLESRSRIGNKLMSITQCYCNSTQSF
jgi:hypothetical protein